MLKRVVGKRLEEDERTRVDKEEEDWGGGGGVEGGHWFGGTEGEMTKPQVNIGHSDRLWMIFFNQSYSVILGWSKIEASIQPLFLIML